MASPLEGRGYERGVLNEHAISHEEPGLDNKKDLLQCGILPTSEKYAPDFGGWNLPGHGVAYDSCGQWRIRGCNNVEDHPNTLSWPSGGTYVEVYRRCCMRSECPECYEAWVYREADRAQYRLKAYKGGRLRRPIHVAASIPKHEWDKPISFLRSKLYKILRKCGIFGGCAIFHPWRQEKKGGWWYLSPHFHIVGYGWVRGTAQNYEATGWIVKNIGLRKTVYGTLTYQLSHCGIKKKIHTLTWFGCCSYNKLIIAPYKPEPNLCPICGAELRPFIYGTFSGLDPPFDKTEGAYYVVNGQIYLYDTGEVE